VVLKFIGVTKNLTDMNTLVITNQTATRMVVIASRTNSELIAGAKAMMIQELKNKLYNGVAHFLYTKKNGEIREAWGTTNPTLAAKYTNGRGCSREMYATTAYFDIEKSAWRSFRWENIVKVF
jgi:hypothetical protein